jgi:hypothetical protein
LRLDKYIGVDQNIEFIKRDCKLWLKETKPCKTLFMRGMRISDKTFFKKKVRQDRKPMNMDDEEKEMIDNGFKWKFGWRPRTEGLFITTDTSEARGYGIIHWVFPIGNFNYLWSKEVGDMYADIPTVIGKLRRTRGMSKIHWARRLPDLYTDTNICGATKTGNEVMVKCSAYYALRAVLEYEYEEEVWKKIYK